MKEYLLIYNRVQENELQSEVLKAGLYKNLGKNSRQLVLIIDWDDSIHKVNDEVAFSYTAHFEILTDPRYCERYELFSAEELVAKHPEWFFD